MALTHASFRFLCKIISTVTSQNRGGELLVWSLQQEGMKAIVCLQEP